MQATNGVVLATEKKLRSTLIDESTVKKISVVSPNIGLAYSGMGPDSRLLVRRARKQAQVHCLPLAPCMGPATVGVGSCHAALMYVHGIVQYSPTLEDIDLRLLAPVLCQLASHFLLND